MTISHPQRFDGFRRAIFIPGLWHMDKILLEDPIHRRRKHNGVLWSLARAVFGENLANDPATIIMRKGFAWLHKFGCIVVAAVGRVQVDLARIIGDRATNAAAAVVKARNAVIDGRGRVVCVECGSNVLATGLKSHYGSQRHKNAVTVREQSGTPAPVQAFAGSEPIEFVDVAVLLEVLSIVHTGVFALIRLRMGNADQNLRVLLEMESSLRRIGSIPSSQHLLDFIADLRNVKILDYGAYRGLLKSLGYESDLSVECVNGYVYFSSIPSFFKVLRSLPYKFVLIYSFCLFL
jgi:hypothetical protein